jgi:hypothetical protein
MTKRPVDSYAWANRKAAEIIMASPQCYGGDGSLMVEWARAVIRKQET